MENEISPKQEEFLTITRRGHEHPVDQSDLMIPRAMLIQFTPPKNIAIDPAVHTPGKFINSITTDVLPMDQNEVPFIPILRSVIWIRFNSQRKDDKSFDPQFEPGAMIWRSDDPSDLRVIKEGAWGENNEPPLATKFINYLVLLPGHPMPLVLSFGKTSFKAGKILTTMTESAPGDLFSYKYKLRSVLEQNNQQQKYYVMAVKSFGKASEEEFRQAEAIYNMFAGKKLKVHEEEQDQEADAPKAKNPWD